MNKISIAELMRTYKPEDKVFITNTKGERKNEPRTIFKIDTTAIISKNENGKKIWLPKPTSKHDIFKDGNGNIIIKKYLYEDGNDLIISRTPLMFKHQEVLK